MKIQMGSMSKREKRLLLFLGLVLSFMLWYKIFGGILLPRYQELRQDLALFPEMNQSLPTLAKEVEAKERDLTLVQADLELLRNAFSPGSGFLLTTLGKLADGKVIIEGIEPRQFTDGGVYQIQSFQVTVRGVYGGVLDYFQALESHGGLQIGAMEIQLDHEAPELVEAGFLIHHYMIPTASPITTEPTFVYTPSRLFNPFENMIVETELQDQDNAETDEIMTIPESDLETEKQDDWTLEPYIFPIR